MKRIIIILITISAFFLSAEMANAIGEYICLDPGHGGIDAGNVGRVYGLLEKDVNLGVGLMTYSHLVSWYWWPIMTRTEDIKIDRLHKTKIDKKTCKILENNLSCCKALIQI